MSDPPPAYQAGDIDDVIGRLSGLTVTTRSRPITPPTPEIIHPATPPAPSQRLYEIHSATLSGVTTQWSQAAHLTQGVPGGHATAVVNTPKKHSKKGGIAVFFGVSPGPYASWFGPNGAEVQVRRIPGAVYQGYKTLAEASAAFSYAEAKGWTGVRTSRLATAPSSTPLTVIPTLPAPVDLLARPCRNPLHGARSSPVQTWYVVYAGITPSIYMSL
ncbi:hypothetical protein C8R43DRAFT_1122467 [Mycena crocata]|nr:hypothetical protein C8R43DRAFT_1122467 [Mycena crocata]